LTEPPCLCSHHGVKPRIEGFVFAKYRDAEEIFFQFAALPSHFLVHDKTQKPAELRRMNESLAGKNYFELSSNCTWREILGFERMVMHSLVRIAIALIE
jgi:hypothetical protein